MSTKHYPFYGGSFDRIIFDGDGSVWVPESENAKLRELVRAAWKCVHVGLSCSDCRLIAGGCTLQSAMRELGVDA